MKTIKNSTWKGSAVLLGVFILLSSPLSEVRAKDGNNNHSSKIGQSDDSNNGKSGNRVNGRGNRHFLKTDDESMIERKIEEKKPLQRMGFLVIVLSRIDKLEANIQNSNMDPARKERFIAILEEVRDLVQTRLEQAISGGNANDVTPPVISSFGVTGISSNSATLSATLNEPWVGYYVVLLGGSPAPSAAQVRLWQSSTGQIVSVKGSSVMGTGVTQFTISGLSPSSNYVLYFTASDSNNNLQQTLQTAAFTTPSGPANANIPNISSLIVDTVTSSGARLVVTSDRAGNGYFVILTNGSATPSTTQIRKWQNASSQATPLVGSTPITSGTTQLALQNLTPNSLYLLYFVAGDTNGNLMTAPISFFFMTPPLDTTAPTVSTLSVTGTTSTGTTFSSVVSESGTGYYVLLPSGALAPTAAQVKLGLDGSGQVAPFRGSGITTNGTNTFAINGLSPNTSYRLYFTAEDASHNLQQVLQSILIVTNIQ